jgi:hypothetical protein
MFSMKLLLTTALLIGIFAEECTIGDLGIEDFSDKVTVTNVSEEADAFVAVKFNHGQVTMYVEAGKARTAMALASTKYTVKVTEPISSSDYGYYRGRLLGLRDRLIQLTLAPAGATPDEVANAWTELSLVQTTLDQMKDSEKVQSCSGKLKTDVTSQVILKRAETSDGGALWVLDCG